MRLLSVRVRAATIRVAASAFAYAPDELAAVDANWRVFGVARSVWLYKQSGPFLQNMRDSFARPHLHAICFSSAFVGCAKLQVLPPSTAQ